MAILTATNPTLFAEMAKLMPGDTLRLSGSFGPVTIAKAFPGPIFIEAWGASFAGVTFNKAANIQWSGGTILSKSGAVSGPDGYGMRIYNGSANISILGTRFGMARKAAVLDGSSNIAICGCLFAGVGEDSIIASAIKRLTVTGNVFRDTVGKATSCKMPDGTIREGLAQRDCSAQGGVWTDGFHADAVQMRNGVTDALIAGNVIRGNTQGIAQMDTTGDAPCEGIRVLRNDIETSTYHPITLGAAPGSVIAGNNVRRSPGSTAKKQIIAGAGVLSCGNTVQDVQNGTGACPAGQEF